MIPIPRFSIAGLMKVVFVVAIDIAIFRASMGFGSALIILALITLPMISLLLLTLRRSRGEHGERLFWLVFQATGWGLVLLLVTCTLFFHYYVLFPVYWVFARMGSGPLGMASLAFHFVFPIVAYTIPQVMVATMAGLLVSRFRVVIERRYPISSVPEGGHGVAGEVG